MSNFRPPIANIDKPDDFDRTNPDAPVLKNKYLRDVPDRTIDVYDVLMAFRVTCPARQHAIKKLLCAGLRGVKDEGRDLMEAEQALRRSMDILSEKNVGGYGEFAP